MVFLPGSTAVSMRAARRTHVAPRAEKPSAGLLAATAPVQRKPIAYSAAEKPFGEIELFSKRYYGVCAIGGIMSCGLTHTAVVPLDLVKCRMQVDPVKYPGIFAGFGNTVKAEGITGLTRGWLPTAIGYSMQGACKFGFYELFKHEYEGIVGPENFEKYQDFVYLAASASAEFIADVALCPMEAVKVRVQTSEGWAKGLSDGFPKFVSESGYGGLYKGLTPLWGRQIPYTMVKFASFERVVQLLYSKVFTKGKENYNKQEQLGVSFMAGYIAGVFCAIVSHPADSIVSKLNKNPEATIGSIVKETPFMTLLTKGLVARIIMIGTLTGLQWGIYDAFKVYVGLPTTGHVKK